VIPAARESALTTASPACLPDFPQPTRSAPAEAASTVWPKFRRENTGRCKLPWNDVPQLSHALELQLSQPFSWSFLKLVMSLIDFVFFYICNL
jgi:hypothetical protein